MVVPFFRNPSVQTFSKTVVLTSLVLTGFVVALRHLGALEAMELDAYDRFIRMTSHEDPDERILVVGISEEDIQRRQEYPIHDGTLADVLTKLETYEPRAIGLDIGRDVPMGPSEGRSRMIEVLQESDRIIAACLLSSSTQPGVPAAPGASPDRIGFADFPEDIGGIVRRSLVVSAPTPPPVLIGEPHLCNDASPENEVLSLSFLLALVYLEEEGIVPEPTDWGEIRLRDTILHPLTTNSGGYAGIDAVDYQIMLNYRSGRDAVRQVTLTQVLEGQVEPDWIRDRVVLIGYTSQVANDILTTPFDETLEGFRGMPGVVVHAQAVSQILSAVLDQRPLIGSWPMTGEILWIWAWSLAGGTLAFYSRRLSRFVLIGAGLLIGCWGLSYFLFLQGVWVPLIPSLSLLMITAVGVSLVDRAHHSGYAQAIYEQLQAQFRKQQQGTQTAYLEDLVRRARAIRQRRSGETPDANWLSSAEDPTQLNLDDPRMQALYNQIKAQAQQDWQEEQAALQEARTEQSAAHQPEIRWAKRGALDIQKSGYLEDLMQRAKATRQRHGVEEQNDNQAPSGSKSTLQPQQEEPQQLPAELDSTPTPPDLSKQGPPAN